MSQKVFLGECEFYGRTGAAFREVYENCWKFVVIVEGIRHVLMTY
ncbi:hypothetical protein AWH56_26405 [Anaerobacillus isosaccharinicus]|uniref:Uncharacterized protein n=1 Tax=Anaerobacillus isosaccharinicus TaxID=1532552 RepID=A0AC62A480_9BACI|nr:hypothetical protein [Anaerobacillus isosaccharinicus]